MILIFHPGRWLVVGMLFASGESSPNVLFKARLRSVLSTGPSEPTKRQTPSLLTFSGDRSPFSSSVTVLHGQNGRVKSIKGATHPQGSKPKGKPDCLSSANHLKTSS
jgi:hypothetical protein